MIKDKQYFQAYISGLISKAERGALCFTRFLASEEKELCAQMLRSHKNIGHLFYGGHPQSDKVCLGISPEGCVPDPASFPISVLETSIPESPKLSHRDFLGAILSEGIERDCVGDIIVSYEFMKAYVFIYSTVSGAVADVGAVGRCKTVFRPVSADKIMLPEKQYADLTFTVSSPRLDAVISGFLNCSRERSSEIIREQRVHLRNREIIKSDTEVRVDDVISVRGFGKYRIDYIGESGKKGRKRVLARKYV